MSPLRSFLLQLLITLLMAAGLLALYVAGGRLVLMPLLETQVPRLQDMLSEQLKQPVTLTSLEGSWSLFSPIVTLQDMVIGEGDTQLTIGTVSAELDISSSLFHQLPIFKRILVDRVDLTLQQEYLNQFNLGNPLQKGSGQVDIEALRQRPGWLDWLEHQDNIVLRDWQVTNLHPDDVTETLMIRRVAWRNQGQQHSLEGDIAWGLNEDLADIFISADIRGQLWPLGAQDGDIYLLVDEQQWARWVPETLPRDLSVKSMRASLEGWLSLSDGDLQSLYIRTVVPEFSVEAPQNALNLTNGTLMISGERTDEDWHLQILPRFAEPLPISEVRLSSVRLDNDRGWNVRIPETDLTEASQFLLDFNLMPEPFDRYLENLAPQGQAGDVRVSYLFGAGEFDFRADVTDFGVQPYKGIPMLTRADGEVHLQKLGGVARIRDNDLTMHLPDIYQPQWDLTEASAAFFWEIEPDLFRLHLRDLDAHLDDTRVRGNLALRIPREHADVENHISLILGVENGPVALQQKLVPDIIDPAINEWLDSSLLEGDLSQVGFVLDGTLGEETPDNSLTTQLSLQADNARLTYLEGWPTVTSVKGRVYLDAPDVDIDVDEGHTLGGDIIDQSGRVQIRSKDDDTLLSVRGRINGNTSEALAYLQTTPLAEMLDGALETWKASGNATTDLNLKVSLSAEDSEPQVDLVTQLNDTRLDITDLDLSIQHLNGVLSFNSDSGLWADKLTAQMFGGPLTAEITSQLVNDNYLITLRGQGDAGWEPLSDWLGLFLLDPVGGRLAYHSEVFIDPGAEDSVQILLESDLTGTSVDLPFPMGKTADEPRPLTALIRAGNETRMNIKYGNLVRTALTLDAETSAPRGQVVIGGAAPQHTDTTGISILGHIDQTIYAEPWWDTFDRLLTLSEAADAEARAAGDVVITDSLGNTNPVALVDLTLADVDVYDYPSGPTHVTGNQLRGQWALRVESDLMAGNVVIPADTAAPLDLVLDYVRLPDDTEVPPEPADPAVIPPDPLAGVLPTDMVAMDVELQEFYMGTRNLGYWQLNTRPLENGVRVNFLNTDMKGLHITGPVDWKLTDGLSHTDITGLELRATNVEEVQKAFRQQAIIKGKEMDSQVNLGWDGSPLGFNTQTLNGNVAMRIKDGSVDLEGASAMRAVGALNVNSIFRRLRLDFSDVVNSGMAFDTLKGKADIVAGQLTLTEPVTLEGPGGKLLTSGVANLNTGELDLKLAVTFPITGTLPLVAVLAGFAPPVAASIYVTERLVGDELERFSSASYSIKGTFTQPDVQLNKAFDNSVDGKTSRSFVDRFLSIFGLDDE